MQSAVATLESRLAEATAEKTSVAALAADLDAARDELAAAVASNAAREEEALAKLREKETKLATLAEVTSKWNPSSPTPPTSAAAAAREATLEDEIARLREKISAMSSEMEAKDAAVARTTYAAALEGELKLVKAELAEMRAAFALVRETSEDAASAEIGLKRRVAELEGLLEAARSSDEDVEARVADLESRLEEANAELVAAKEEASETESSLRAKVGQLREKREADRKSANAEREDAIAALRAELDVINAALADAKANHTAAERALVVQEQETLDALEEVKTLRAERASADEESTRLAAKLAAFEAEKAAETSNLEEEIAAMSKALAKKDEALDAALRAAADSDENAAKAAEDARAKLEGGHLARKATQIRRGQVQDVGTRVRSAGDGGEGWSRADRDASIRARNRRRRNRAPVGETHASLASDAEEDATLTARADAELKRPSRSARLRRGERRVARVQT